MTVYTWSLKMHHSMRINTYTRKGLSIDYSAVPNRWDNEEREEGKEYLTILTCGFLYTAFSPLDFWSSTRHNDFFIVPTIGASRRFVPPLRLTSFQVIFSGSFDQIVSCNFTRGTVASRTFTAWDCIGEGSYWLDHKGRNDGAHERVTVFTTVVIRVCRVTRSWNFGRCE